MNIKRVVPYAVGFVGGVVCSTLFFIRKIKRLERLTDELYDYLVDSGMHISEDETGEAEKDYHFSERSVAEEEVEPKPEKFPDGDFEVTFEKKPLRLIDEDAAGQLVRHMDYSLESLTYFLPSDDMKSGYDYVDDLLAEEVKQVVGYDALLGCMDQDIVYVANDGFTIVYEVTVRKIAYEDFLREEGVIADD